MPVTREQEEQAEALKTLVNAAVKNAVQESTAGMRQAVTNAVSESKEAVVSNFELKSFSGNVTDNFDEWLKRFNRLAQANNWVDDRKKNILPYYLVGSAEQVYDNTTQAQRATFDALVAALKDKFKPAQLSDLRSVELHSHCQGAKESVGDFAQAIQKLTKQAYPEVEDAARKQLMKRFFLNGLRQDLRRLVLIAKPATFEEAETQARAQEATDHVVFGSAPI